MNETENLIPSPQVNSLLCKIRNLDTSLLSSLTNNNDYQDSDSWEKVIWSACGV